MRTAQLKHVRVTAILFDDSPDILQKPNTLRLHPGRVSQQTNPKRALHNTNTGHRTQNSGMKLRQVAQTSLPGLGKPIIPVSCRVQTIRHVTARPLSLAPRISVGKLSPAWRLQQQQQRANFIVAAHADIPAAQGLFNPLNDKDSCGVGFIAGAQHRLLHHHCNVHCGSGGYSNSCTFPYPCLILRPLYWLPPLHPGSHGALSQQRGVGSCIHKCHLSFIRVTPCSGMLQLHTREIHNVLCSCRRHHATSASNRRRVWSGFHHVTHHLLCDSLTHFLLICRVMGFPRV